MFPLFQQSGKANRRWRPDLTVKQRPRRRRFALSLPSAPSSNVHTQNRRLPSDSPSSGKHHTQADPTTKSGNDAVAFWQPFAFRIELSRGSGSRRKLNVASRDFTHHGQNASDWGARVMSCKQAESITCGSFFAPSLSKGGRNSGAMAACNAADRSGNQGAPKRTTTI
jgi:hypothetical protein